MAKSSNFFGLRRGSTKSLTFQVFRGMQITKDRVVSVQNPQTAAQMEQRLKLPIVAATRAVLSTLVDHSFQDVDYGDKSLKEFSSVNLTKNALTVANYTPKGVSDLGLADYIVSRGSLTPEVIEISNDLPTSAYSSENISIIDGYPALAGWQAAGELSNIYVNKAYAAGASIDADLLTQIAEVLGLADGEQLTFLAARRGDEYTYQNAGQTLTGHYHRYVISRLINDISKVTAWTVKTAVSATSNDVTLTDGYLDLAIPFANLHPRVTLTHASETNVLQGLAVIRSAKDGNTWRRSTARMHIFLTEEDYKSASYSNVYESYMRPSGTTSNKYLNTGAEGVDITGGNS